MKEVYKNRTYEVRLDLFAIKCITGALLKTKTKILTSMVLQIAQNYFLTKIYNYSCMVYDAMIFPPQNNSYFPLTKSFSRNSSVSPSDRVQLKDSQEDASTKGCNFCDSVKCELMKMSRHQMKVLKQKHFLVHYAVSFFFIKIVLFYTCILSTIYTKMQVL